MFATQRKMNSFLTMGLLSAALLLVNAAPSNADGTAGKDGTTSSAAAASASETKPSATDRASEATLAAVNELQTELQSEVQQLKQLLEREDRKIDQQQKALEEQQKETQDVKAQLALARVASASPAAVSAAPGTSIAHETSTAASTLPQSSAASTLPVSQSSNQNQINIVSPDHPLSVKLGGAYFTPGGFVDFTGIYRSADVGSGLGTNFTTLPYNNALPLGGLSEFRFTGQGTRMSLKVEAKPSSSTAVTGYIESDFNGFEPANSNISSKSDTFRLRLAFLQVSHNKWDLVTGQTWSLLTPTREGISPFPENIFTALRLDTSYLAGLVFDRQPGIRVVYHPTKWWALAVALENPQQFVPSSVVFPTDGATNFFSTQFDNGSSSTTAASAAINPTVPNLHPDIIAKTSFDWRFGGKLLHVDVGGVARSFKVYNNLVTPTATNTITGGGGQINVNYELFKHFHLIENAFYGDGAGRYIGGLGPDVVVKPNGTLSAVHSGSAVAGFEWQATPKLMLDAYTSGAYFWRNYDVTTKALGTACGATSFCVGFGFPGSANTNNRDYQEASFGIIPTIWSSPNYGKLQFISQFSYVVRSPWYVPAGTPKDAHAVIAYVNLRYIIP